MNKKEIRKQNNISMEKFLREYVGIQNEQIITFLTTLTHKEIKEMGESLSLLDLTRKSFESVTKDQLQTGEILIVIDSEKNPAPYKNPQQKQLDEMMQVEKERRTKEAYDVESHIQTFDDYIDDIEEISQDRQIKSQRIKVLSKQKYKTNS